MILKKIQAANRVCPADSPSEKGVFLTQKYFRLKLGNWAGILCVRSPVQKRDPYMLL